MMWLTFLVATFLVANGFTGALAGEQREQEQQSIAAKLPVPDNAARAKALAIVKQVFDEDYRSRKVEDRRALVLKLSKQADDPANEAARIAAEAGDADTALEAAARKASRFKDDPLRLQLDTLSVVSRTTLGPEDQTSLVAKWISLAVDISGK